MATPNSDQQTIIDDTSSIRPDPNEFMHEQQDTSAFTEFIPGQESSSSSLAIKGTMQALLAMMRDLRQDFDVKVKYDESKERVIESLHKELLLHREGLHFRVLRPMFLDLIVLHDDMGKLIDNISDEPSISIAQIVQHLLIFQDSIEGILHNNGVEVFIVEEEIFLPGKQRAQSIIPTLNPAQDKHIARRVRQGFEYEGKLLRHEIVEVYKYTSVTSGE